MMGCHQVDAASVRPQIANQRFMVDTHSHFHACFDVEQFIDVAIKNATRYGNVTPCLMLADPASHNSLIEIAKKLVPSESGLAIECHCDTAIVKRDGSTALVLIRGRQIRTQENLEILSYGAPKPLSDGDPFRDTLRQVVTSARIGIIPWSFGKWWGRRRHVLRCALNELAECSSHPISDVATIALGDNGCRPKMFQLGGSLRGLIKTDIRVLPGSDPLALKSEIDRIGEFGMLVEIPRTTITSADVADRLLNAVANGQIITVGRRISLARCVPAADRVEMQSTREAVIQKNAPPKLRSTYDIVVVGGGILGLCVAFEACRRKQSVLVVERDSIGSAASGNTLRIIHGGIRHLQQLGLKRFRESQAEQRWFLSKFPQHTRPLPCVLPLDGSHFRKPIVARAASFAFRILTPSNSNARLPHPVVMSRAAVAKQFNCELRTPSAFVWHDATITDPDALLQALIADVRRHGGELLESCRCERVEIDDDGAPWIRLRSTALDESIQIRCSHAVICCGPGNSLIADQSGIRFPGMRPVTAYNLVFDTNPELACGIAIPGATRTFFAVPRGDQLAVGTGYTSRPTPSSAEIGDLIEHLRRGLHCLNSTWDLSCDIIHRAETGVIVSTDSNASEPASCPTIFTDKTMSVTFATTPKYTVARLVAEKVLNRIGKVTLPKQEPM